MPQQRRIAEAEDAIINMYSNGIAINAISRTLRIAPFTIRKVLDRWRATVGVVAMGRAKLASAVEPACATVTRAVKTDDKAAFRLLEGMGVLGDAQTGALSDKSISIAINNLLSGPSTASTTITHSTTSSPVSTSTGSTEPSSREGPTGQMQLQNGAQNFGEIVEVDDNKGLNDEQQQFTSSGSSERDDGEPERADR